MRLGENGILCSFWKDILQGYAQGIRSDAYSSHYAKMALECFAAYANWIDVGLVVDGETLKLIYFLLQDRESKIQLAAADFLAEIVAKGMPAGDKIALASYMNLTSVFEAVGQRGLPDGFFCKCCRVLSNLAGSLGQQVQLAAPSLTQSVQEQVVQYTCPVLLPHLLRFLQILTTQPRDNRAADEWEEGLTALLPFISNTFEIARSMRDQLRPDQVDFMGRFLPLCIDLMQLADEEVISEADSGDDEIRVALMQAFDSVLWLQGHATLAMMNSLKTGQLTLGRCELLARLTLRVPEGMRGQPTFSLSINGESRMTPISEIVTWTIERIPERFPQLIPLICDVLVRYSSSAYLDVFPDKIDGGLRLLMRLLELRGFRETDCEKMLKFVKNLKGKLGGYAGVLLTALQQHHQGSLHLSGSLYEIAGLAVASIDARSVPVEGLTGSLLQGALESSMRPDTAIVGLECLGCFAKGFMTDSCLDPTIVRSWYREYCNGFLLAHLQGNSNAGYLNSLIGFSQRIIPLLHVDSIPLIRQLAITIIKSNPDGEGISPIELMSQLLPLLTASLFKLRDQFACPEVLGGVWSILLPRVDELLTQPIQGTDDLLQNMALSKSWLSFLLALGTSNGINCTLSQRNPLVETTIMKIISSSTGSSNNNSSSTSNNSEVIGILRSLCGVVNRCQGHLSRDFINCNLIPSLLHRTLPELFRSLDPSSKRNQASIPAALLNLLQDFLLLLRSLLQNGNLNEEWCGIGAVDMVRIDVKESRAGLVNYFLSSL